MEKLSDEQDGAALERGASQKFHRALQKGGQALAKKWPLLVERE